MQTNCRLRDCSFIRNPSQFVQHFDGLFDDYIGRFWREGAAADFISSFDVQMRRRKISGRAVAVRNHERKLIWRNRLNRHSDFRQDLAAESDKGNVTYSRGSDIIRGRRAVFFNLKLASRLARKIERYKGALNVTAGGKFPYVTEDVDDLFAQQRSKQHRLRDPARLGIESR